MAASRQAARTTAAALAAMVASRQAARTANRTATSRTTARLALAACLALAAGGCSLSESPPVGDLGLEGLDLSAVQPAVVVPGSTIVVSGRSFVDAAHGTSRLVLRGSFDGGDGDRDVEVALPLRFVGFERMEATVDAALLADLGAAAGDFHGSATVEVDSAIDGDRHQSRALGASLAVRAALTPRLDRVSTGEVIFVNDAIQVVGDGLLLDPGEGQTVAVVEGCFAAAAGELCVPLPAARVPVTPVEPFARDRGRFAFAPAIAGIRPGAFTGTVSLENRPAAGGPTTASGALDADYRVVDAELTGTSPTAVSLGQYLYVHGGGFVGAPPTADGGDDAGRTLLRLVGSYLPHGGAAVAVDTIVVPEFVDGQTLRYVANEDDDLGAALGLRGAGGTLSGTVTPLLSYGDDDVTGEAQPFAIEVAPVKQVVYLNFTTAYTASLQAFGLRAIDAALRDRIAAVVARDYATVNLEVRDARPTDFALYAEVEIGGPDPNGLALLGYDNTPGKDVGNQRLYDRMGGVNAVTQQDGFPGYGGVFVESLFVFSAHPGGYVEESLPAAEFDDVFDPFRPDRGGKPVRAGDLGGGVDLMPTDGDGCPADDRAGRIRCAIWVLGALIGTTVSHELGHSLGLANPDGPDVHLFGDLPGRLMESGGGRDFLERAELGGAAPGQFCDAEYAYLRSILPSPEAADPSARPPCD